MNLMLFIVFLALIVAILLAIHKANLDYHNVDRSIAKLLKGGCTVTLNKKCIFCNRAGITMIYIFDNTSEVIDEECYDDIIIGITRFRQLSGDKL